MHLDEHFGLLLDMPSIERTRYIAELELREPEMSVVLRDLFDDDAPAPVRRAPIEPGSRLGNRFKLIQPFAVGGFGAVWLAHDETLHRSCAVKVFPPSGDEAEQRVMNEARTAARIRSQNVVEVVDAGRADQQGPLFIAMELVAEFDERGDPIGKPTSLAQATLPDVDETVALMQQICDGVSAAHRMGILHRDLKPDNCFWVGGVAKVGDFGLSTAGPLPPSGARLPATATMSLTVDGERQLVGTPAYMAPELVEGAPASVASDIYALGATLYHLLAGRPPYEPRDATGAPGLDVVAQVRLAKPPKLRKVAPWVPLRLARIVEHAMNRDPRNRYGSADDLRFELESFARQMPGLVVSSNALSRAALFAKRNAGLLQLATLALVFVAVVGFAAFAARSDALQERTRRQAAEQRLVSEAVTRSTIEDVLERTQRTAAAAMTRARNAEIEREHARARGEMLARSRHALEQAQAALQEQLDTIGQALLMSQQDVQTAREESQALSDALARSRKRARAAGASKAAADRLIDDLREDRERAFEALVDAEQSRDLAIERATLLEAALADATDERQEVQAALETFLAERARAAAEAAPPTSSPTPTSTGPQER